jgi:hypothetical protein
LKSEREHIVREVLEGPFHADAQNKIGLKRRSRFPLSFWWNYPKMSGINAWQCLLSKRRVILFVVTLVLSSWGISYLSSFQIGYKSALISIALK